MLLNLRLLMGFSVVVSFESLLGLPLTTKVALVPVDLSGGGREFASIGFVVLLCVVRESRVVTLTQ